MVRVMSTFFSNLNQKIEKDKYDMIIKMKGYNEKGNVAIFKRLNLKTYILSCEHDIGMYNT